ncbi:MAG: hypothetical protein V3V14_12230 [Saprospiraceae bacterium]
MRFLSLVLIVMIIISCGKSDIRVTCEEVDYDTAFVVELDDEVCFPDGSTLIIKNFIYMFCGCDEICVWEGELGISVKTIDSEMEENTFSFGVRTFLPTQNGKIFDDYYISSITYTYDGEINNIPCEDEFDPKKITMTMIISPDE